MDGALVSAGQVVLKSLLLTNGAVLTHPPADGDQEYKLALTADTLIIEDGSRIDVTERGYLGALRGANGNANSGRTLGNTTVGGSTRRVGGTYGGIGANGDAEPGNTSPYGSFRSPNELGSGGGSDSGAGGSGGGLVQLELGSLTLNGQILANGGPGSRYAGAGSGGGIRIRANSLSGSGLIQANGGSSGPESGSGGGGRVAIVSSSVNGFDLSHIQAYAGSGGYQIGSPGTIYLEYPTEPTGQLVIDANPASAPTTPTRFFSLGRGANSALAASVLTDTNAVFSPGSLIGLRLNPNPSQGVTFTILSNTVTQIFTDPQDGDMTAVSTVGATYQAIPFVGRLTARNGAVVELLHADNARFERYGTFRATRAEWLSGSVLTHPFATPVVAFGLELTVDDLLSVDDTSRIETDARGYLGALNAGNPTTSGRTDGNSTAAGSTLRNGGSYGGSGGFGNSSGNINPQYGDRNAPSSPGSGGGSDSGAAGNGGGVIRVYAGSLSLQGSIRAQGGNGGRYGGGGSGGSVWINTGSLTGTGSITARGGNGGAESGGGGGGRVAVYYQQSSSFDLASILALGGSGLSAGSPGSVVVKQATFVPPAPLNVVRPTPRIYEIQLTGTAAAPQPATTPDPQGVIVKWTGVSGQRYTVEISTDLIHWSAVAVTGQEISGGHYQALIPTSGAGATNGFFRIRSSDTGN